MVSTILGQYDINIPMPEGAKIPPQSKFLSVWKLGDKVIIDDDKSIKTTVTGFLFEKDKEQVRVEWFSNGDAKSLWVDTWRVKGFEE